MNKKGKVHSAEQYAKDVLNGKVLAGAYIKKACQRYFDDMENKAYYFDREDAELYLDFMHLLCLTKSQWAGKPFIQEPWQQFITWNLFGWKMKATNERRFTEATISVPKKNGKTEYAAALALTVALLDQDYGGQIYMAATAREQASLCFQTAKEMVKLSPGMAEHYELLANSIYIPTLSTSIKAISSEASTAEGKGANCVIFDEEHEQVTNNLRDNLRTGMASRPQPLFVSISTAGTNKVKPYYNHIGKCKQILNGVLKDDRHFILIYEPDEGDDWSKESTWGKANPNYGVTVRKDFMHQQYRDALNEPSKQPTFKTKHLNVWTDTAKTWISHDVWMECVSELKLSDYKGKPAIVAVDLSKSRDFTVACIGFPVGSNGLHLFWRYYLPETMAKTRSYADATNVREWQRRGFVTVTEGNVVDYEVMITDLKTIRKDIPIQSVAFDPQYNANPFVVRMMDENFNMQPFSQGIMNMSTPTKEFEKMIMQGTLQHENNPVTDWMLSNVAIFADANDNIKVHKGKSSERVDGVVAAIMCVGEWMQSKHELIKTRSVYETRGIQGV